MATFTIELPLELEQRLYEVTRQRGIEPNYYILELLRERLTPQLIDATESALIEHINIGLPQDTWKYYQALIGKRQSEDLSATEQAELIAISEQIEKANVQRIQALIILAERHGVSLEKMSADLGITKPSYV